jgi:hypothetical protein
MGASLLCFGWRHPFAARRSHRAPRDLRGSHGSTAAELRPGVFEEPACAGAYVGAVSTLTDDATATFPALVTP